MTLADLREEAERTLGARSEKRKRTAPKRKAGIDLKRIEAEAARRNRARVYRAVDIRSGGVCEFGASTFCCGDAEEHDHFWGRGKAEETAETVWHLCKFHHDRKTANEPSRAQWLRWFRDHCFRNGFTEQQAKCDRALALELAQHPSPPASPQETP